MEPVVADPTLLQVEVEVEVDIEPLCLADQVVVVLRNPLFQYQHLQDLTLLLLVVVDTAEQKQIPDLEME